MWMYNTDMLHSDFFKLKQKLDCNF